MNDSYNVLFLCTGNSARSILAEAIMNHRGAPQFHGFSAGSHPTGTVNPNAIKLLASARLPTEGLRSKSWDEFAKPGAPEMDFIFTVCDAAAGESCPLWPGHPITAHWGIPDPAAVHGTAEEIERAFRDVYFTLEKRIELFLRLPHASLDAMEMRAKCAEIGRA
jgi:arsenate reductase